jgi:enolase
MGMASRKVQLKQGFLFQGIYAFTTTGATLDVVLPFTRVESVVVTSLGGYAAADQLSVNETVTGTAGTDNAHIAGSNGTTTVTVTRDSGGTSGLKFSLIAFGR